MQLQITSATNVSSILEIKSRCFCHLTRDRAQLSDPTEQLSLHLSNPVSRWTGIYWDFTQCWWIQPGMMIPGRKSSPACLDLSTEGRQWWIYKPLFTHLWWIPVLSFICKGEILSMDTVLETRSSAAFLVLPNTWACGTVDWIFWVKPALLPWNSWVAWW